MTDWHIDKSALVRLGASPDAAGWASRVERGLVRITTLARLEVDYSARSDADLRAGLRQPPVSGFWHGTAPCVRRRCCLCCWGISDPCFEPHCFAVTHHDSE